MDIANHNLAARSLLVRALLALSAISGLCFADPAFALDTGDIVVASTKGEVHVTIRGSETKLRAGAVLELPATVRTGRDGALELRQGATSISIGPDSLLEFPALEKPGGSIDRIVQPRGTSFYSVGKRGGRKLRIETPFLVGVVKGTQFSVVAQEHATTISLFEGLLEVRSADDSDVIDLHAGEVASRDRAATDISVIRMESNAAPPVQKAPPPKPPAGAIGNPAAPPSSPARPAGDASGPVLNAGRGDDRKPPRVEPSTVIEVPPAHVELAVDTPVNRDENTQVSVETPATGGANVDVAVETPAIGGASVDVGAETPADSGGAAIDVSGSAVGETVEVGAAVDVADDAVAVDTGATTGVSVDVSVDLGGVTDTTVDLALEEDNSGPGNSENGNDNSGSGNSGSGNSGSGSDNSGSGNATDVVDTLLDSLTKGPGKK